MKGNKGISLIILVLIAVVVIVVGAVAIVLVMNKDNTPNSTTGTSNAENNLVNIEQSKKPTAEDNIVQTDEYEGIAYVGSRDITINYKTGRRKDTKSSSYLICLLGSRKVSVFLEIFN